MPVSAIDGRVVGQSWNPAQARHAAAFVVAVLEARDQRIQTMDQELGALGVCGLGELCQSLSTCPDATRGMLRIKTCTPR